jgi:hypothetical protein
VQMKELTLNRFAGCNNGGLGTTPMELFQRWVDYWFCFLRVFSFLSRIPIIVALDRIQGVCVLEWDLLSAPDINHQWFLLEKIN